MCAKEEKSLMGLSSSTNDGSKDTQKNIIFPEIDFCGFVF